MGKEIERKWLCNPTEDLKSYLLNPKESYEIKDFYFNEYTRLRAINGRFFITIKSLGNKIRDEFEFEISKNQIDFVMSPCLCKKRVIFPYKGQRIEINVFRDLYMKKDDYTSINLIIAELELSHPDACVDLPEFICFEKEVTNNCAFYGYSLFNRIKHNYDKEIRFNGILK